MQVYVAEDTHPFLFEINTFLHHLERKLQGTVNERFIEVQIIPYSCFIFPCHYIIFLSRAHFLFITTIDARFDYPSVVSSAVPFLYPETLSDVMFYQKDWSGYRLTFSCILQTTAFTQRQGASL